MVAPWICEPGQDTSALRIRVLTVLRWDGRRCSQRVGPVLRVWPLTSQVALGSQASGPISRIAGISEGFHRPCPSLVSLPRHLSFYPALRRLYRGSACSAPPRADAPCWHAIATVHPLGDRDSPGPEPSPDYLTRFGTASHRSWPRSPCITFLTARDHRQRDW
jgi:hypothetical protein